MKTLALAVLLAAGMSTAAAAFSTPYSYYSYLNNSGGATYEITGPTSWNSTTASEVTVIPGAGPNGADAYQINDPNDNNPAQAVWNFGGFGTLLASNGVGGQTWQGSNVDQWYTCQVYVSANEPNNWAIDSNVSPWNEGTVFGGWEH